MVLAINKRWINAFSSGADVEDVDLVRFHLTTGIVEGVDVFTFSNSFRGFADYANTVIDVSPVSNQIDIKTRSFSAGDWVVRIENEATIRSLISSNRMRNKKVSFLYGAENLVEGDFITLGVGAFTEFSVSNNELNLRIRDAAAFLRQTEIDVLNFGTKHPLEHIEDLLILAGVPLTLYDATTLDPSDAAYVAISHWAVARQNVGPEFFNPESAIKKPTNALDLVFELCALMGGSFIPDEFGVYRFKLFDLGAGVDRTLDSDDWEIVRQVDSFRHFANRVEIPTNQEAEGFAQRFVLNDTASQTAHAFPGEPTGVINQVMDKGSQWLNAGGKMVSGDLDATKTTGDFFLIEGSPPSGFSGLRFAPNTGVIPAFAEASATRLVYILITGFAFDSVRSKEIISVDLFINADPGTFIEDALGNNYPNLMDCRIAERGLFDTSVIDWRPPPTINIIRKVFDFTIPVKRTQEQIDRFSNGAEVVELLLDMKHYDLQVTDFVTPKDDRPLGFGFDGVTTGAWELIKKERRRPKFKVLVAKVPGAPAGSVVGETFDTAEPAVPTDNQIFKLDGTKIVNNALADVLHK